MVRRWTPLGAEEIRAWIERHREHLPRTVAEAARHDGSARPGRGQSVGITHARCVRQGPAGLPNRV